MIDDLNWVTAQFPDLTSVARLGHGGQKVVYAATHPTDGAVVLKLIKSNQHIERVAREILAAKQARCARIPEILADGVTAGPAGEMVVWVRERRVEGNSLRQVLEGGPLPLSRALTVAIDVLEALKVAEQQRIVHRDVKPENILIDTSGSAWLVDFGLARFLDMTSLTADAPFGGVGTLGYAPPEQYQNRKRDIDMRADLFALGVTVYEMLYGVHPFREGARDARDVLRRMETLPLPIRVHPDDKKGRMQEFVRTLTQRRREHRPSSADEALTWARELRNKLERA